MSYDIKPVINHAKQATFVSSNSPHKRKRGAYEVLEASNTLKDLYDKTVADKLLPKATQKGQPSLKKLKGISYYSSPLNPKSRELSIFDNSNSLYEVFKELYGAAMAKKLLVTACEKGQPALMKQTFSPSFPPEEITQLILSYLNIRDLANSQRACQTFAILGRDPIVYHQATLNCIFELAYTEALKLPKEEKRKVLFAIFKNLLKQKNEQKATAIAGIIEEASKERAQASCYLALFKAKQGEITLEECLLKEVDDSNLMKLCTLVKIATLQVQKNREAAFQILQKALQLIAKFKNHASSTVQTELFKIIKIQNKLTPQKSAEIKLLPYIPESFRSQLYRFDVRTSRQNTHEVILIELEGYNEALAYCKCVHRLLTDKGHSTPLPISEETETPLWESAERLIKAIEISELPLETEEMSEIHTKVVALMAHIDPKWAIEWATSRKNLKMALDIIRTLTRTNKPAAAYWLVKICPELLLSFKETEGEDNIDDQMDNLVPLFVELLDVAEDHQNDFIHFFNHERVTFASFHAATLPRATIDSEVFENFLISIESKFEKMLAELLEGVKVEDVEDELMNNIEAMAFFNTGLTFKTCDQLKLSPTIPMYQFMAIELARTNTIKAIQFVKTKVPQEQKAMGYATILGHKVTGLLWDLDNLAPAGETGY